jgi:L-histidine N-alpha-methyltransferase
MSLLTIDVLVAPGDRRQAIEHDARVGLTSSPKSLPPVWFYDAHGSQLFDEITRLPEYYLTGAERSILATHASEIAARVGADTLVELGSGTSEKTRLLLDAMAGSDGLRRFVPFDVSEDVLRAAAADIATSYGVDVHAVVGDFHRHLPCIPTGGQRLIAFLGSTVGNLGPAERRSFYRSVRSTMTNDDRLLLGTDLLKSRQRLLDAYDDSRGVTAAFNRNVLAVLNAELHADFELDTFEHVVRWNEHAQWIEMRLRSQRTQLVHVRDLSLEVRFDEGEDLLTEISAKFTVDDVGRELSSAGFAVDAVWTDPAADFLETLARPA